MTNLEEIILELEAKLLTGNSDIQEQINKLKEIKNETMR